MTAKSLLSSTILKRVLTVFLFVLTQKRVMAPSNDNVLGLMRVMCGTRVKLLSFGSREYAVAFKVLKDKVESFMFLFPSTIVSEVLKLNSNEPLHSYAIQSLQSVCNLNTGLQGLQVFNEYWRATMAGSGHHNMSGCLNSLKEIF